MRVQFDKSCFTGDRTYNPGEVGEVPEDVGPTLIKDGFAHATEADCTDFTPPAAPAGDPPKDPPAPAKKK